MRSLECMLVCYASMNMHAAGSYVKLGFLWKHLACQNEWDFVNIQPEVNLVEHLEVQNI